MAHVYLNGEYVDETEAAISACDRGFLYGQGLFETFAAYSGKIFRLDRHLDRMFASASALGMPVTLSSDEADDILNELLDRNNLSDAYLRLTISAGCAPGMVPTGPGEQTVLAVAGKLKRYPREMYERGARVITTQYRLGPLSMHKTLSYFPNVLARTQADEAGADEALMLDDRGRPAEGSASNIFAVAGGTVITPHLSCGVLPGVTRAEVLDIAREEGIPIEEKSPGEAILELADELFLTNTIMGVMPVGRIDGKELPARRPVTQRLAKTYTARIAL